MEAVESRDPEIWRDLLGEARFELAQQLSAQMEEGLDQSATRVWGAGECLKKLGSQRETPVTLRYVNGSTLAEFEAGSASILSFVVQLSGAQLPAVITLIAEQSLREPVRGGHA
jgi:enediyne polyketide synthase